MSYNIKTTNLKKKEKIKMAGNLAGGKKAAMSNKERHGEDFYQRIGRLGGQRGHKGGFAANRELAKRAGRKGGAMSKRGSQSQTMTKILPNRELIEQMYASGDSLQEISKKLNISYNVLGIWARENLDSVERA